MNQKHFACFCPIFPSLLSLLFLSYYTTLLFYLFLFVFYLYILPLFNLVLSFDFLFTSFSMSILFPPFPNSLISSFPIILWYYDINMGSLSKPESQRYYMLFINLQLKDSYIHLLQKWTHVSIVPASMKVSVTILARESTYAYALKDGMAEHVKVKQTIQ